MKSLITMAIASLLRYLAKCFGITRNRIVLLGGEISKHKSVRA